MKDILYQQDVISIVEAIENKSVRKEQMEVLLREVAHEAWIALFPEDLPPRSVKISNAIRAKRWREAIAQVAKHPHSDAVIHVIESSASRERYHWLDS